MNRDFLLHATKIEVKDRSVTCSIDFDLLNENHELFCKLYYFDNLVSVIGPCREKVIDFPLCDAGSYKLCFILIDQRNGRQYRKEVTIQIPRI